MNLKAKSPKGAATEIKKYLVKKFPDQESSIRVLSPSESKIYFGADCWMVSFEDGPYEWAPALTGGSSVFAGLTGNYATPGDFPQGLANDHVWAECQNNFALCFYKQD